MYRKPDDDRLDEAIRAVIKRERHVRSQTAMAELVLNELKRDREDYRISGERIRKVAIERGILEIGIEYNMHDGRSHADVCPVCGYPTDAVSNTTLDGRDADIGYECTKCPYQTGLRKRMPGRYTFSEGRPPDAVKDRISLVRDVTKLMKKAAALVERATEGTEYRKRGMRCRDDIRRIISSNDNDNNLRDLIKDMDNRSKEQPEWSAPLPSVKSANRKDI
ncbi:MAG: hypothetical protein FWD92_00090 [Methanomassiliicoccaceae archaeon]|nr:hypothetical protein [Methanomassiliicoccaceae archaeon]